ncbi:MAG: diguanylate cyclase [Planctomycetota bacterium]
MSEGTRTVRIVTKDEALLASARSAVAGVAGWRVADPQSTEDLLAARPHPGDVVLLDAWLRTENVYESCRRLTGQARTRIYVVTDEHNRAAEAIAAFCGATGTIRRPLTRELLGAILSRPLAPRPLPEEERGEHERVLPERLLRELGGEGAGRLVDALTDPETGLFSYAYLTYKLDEEFKRAQRFGQPLSCVMLGFEGQAEEGVLAELGGTILNASRDTDVLGRFDESSFLFFLPNTGPDGAEVMARRIRDEAGARGLCDLVGDPLSLAVGISFCPHPQVRRREDLFARARAAFLSVRGAGGLLVSHE